MKRNTLSNAMAVGVLTIASGFAVQANAAPSFTFSELAGFNNTGTNGGIAGLQYELQIPVGNLISPQNFAPGPFPPYLGSASGSDLYQRLRWEVPGVDGRTSTLTLSNNPGGAPATQLIPNGVGGVGYPQDGDGYNIAGVDFGGDSGWVDITRIQHENKVIGREFDWGPQNIWGRFILKDSGSVVLDSSDPIAISFNETSNLTPGCPQGAPLGSSCDDFFTYNPAGFGSIPIVANNGSHWLVNFRLDEDSCFEATSGCLVDEPKVYTRETQTTWVDIQAQLVCVEADPNYERAGRVSDCDIKEVPEPSVLMLLGLGLLGVGFSGWWRQKGNVA